MFLAPSELQLAKQRSEREAGRTALAVSLSGFYCSCDGFSRSLFLLSPRGTPSPPHLLTSCSSSLFSVFPSSLSLFGSSLCLIRLQSKGGADRSRAGVGGACCVNSLKHFGHTDLILLQRASDCLTCCTGEPTVTPSPVGGVSSALRRRSHQECV